MIDYAMVWAWLIVGALLLAFAPDLWRLVRGHDRFWRGFGWVMAGLFSR